MEIESTTWDDIMQMDITGNPISEIEIVSLVKEKLAKGETVYLTLEHNPICKLEYDPELNIFRKIVIS